MNCWGIRIYFTKSRFSLNEGYIAYMELLSGHEKIITKSGISLNAGTLNRGFTVCSSSRKLCYLRFSQQWLWRLFFLWGVIQCRLADHQCKCFLPWKWRELVLSIAASNINPRFNCMLLPLFTKTYQLYTRLFSCHMKLLTVILYTKWLMNAK
jgi:hypothetical protein